MTYEPEGRFSDIHKVTITVKGQGGMGTTCIDAQAWSYMSPVRRVLFLHDRLRNVTKGQPFDVLSERRD